MKKKDIFISIILLVALFLLILTENVNYDGFEFKLSVKALLGQELTLEEMKNSKIYQVYKQIDYDTNVEEINHILNKESKNVLGHFETWYYPYGYVSIWYNDEEKPWVLNKVINFEIPPTKKMSEEELYALFEHDSIEDIISTLGEPVMLGESYNKDGKIKGYSYKWGIKTNYSKKFLEDIKKLHGNRVNLPLNDERRIGKFLFYVSTKLDHEIENYSLDYLKGQY